MDTDKQATKKNVTIEDDGGVVYNFGKKRVTPNFEELLEDPIWKDVLLNKWVCMRDDERSVNTFIKHLFNGHRLIQVIYSGEDIYCDGVYKLYKVKIYSFKDGSLFVDPQEFSSAYSSFTFPEGTGYLDRLVEDGYISVEERELFLNKEASEAFAKTLRRMRDDF